MKLPLRFVLILTAIIAAAFLVLAVACGGDDEEGPAAGETPAAAETPAAGETPAATETVAPPGETEEPSGDGGGEAPDIPALPGATMVLTGTGLPFGAFFPEGSPLDPEEFREVQYAVFETDDSIESAVNFYKKEFKGWKEEWTFGGEVEGQAVQMIVWSKDDGKVGAWLMLAEEGGTTSVVIVTGALQ